MPEDSDSSSGAPISPQVSEIPSGRFSPAYLLVSRAQAAFNAGHLERAQEVCRNALAQDPASAEAQALMGVLLCAGGDVEAGLAYLREARRLAPDDFEIRRNLAVALSKTGASGEAADHFVAVATSNPGDREAALEACKALSGAMRFEILSEHVVALLRRWPDAWRAALDLVRDMQGAALSEQAMALVLAVRPLLPSNPASLTEIAIAFANTSRFDEAESAIAEALNHGPDFPAARAALGLLRARQERWSEAVTILEAVIADDPSNVQAQRTLLLACIKNLDHARAFAWGRRFVEIDPDRRPEVFGALLPELCATLDFDALEGLGNTFSLLEKIPARLFPRCALGILPFADDGETTEIVLRAHRDWGAKLERHAVMRALPPLASRPPRAARPRIGMMSSDFKMHSVMRFAMPILEHYDRDTLEIYCYSTNSNPMDLTEEVTTKKVDRYRRVAGQSSTDIARTIRDDEVDILIEMNGITGESGLMAIPYRCAPIQIEWLGYPFTCGLKDLDYLICDRHLAPTRPGLLLERPLMMPDAWIPLGYQFETAVAEQPPVSRNGHITFGSMNNVYKYSRKTLDLWSRVLAAVPNSRLLIVRRQIPDLARTNFLDHMARRGIGADRITIVDSTNPPAPFERFYDDIDISLDTSPLTGGTTTVDSLEMGVPVITLAGTGLHSRISHAILMHIGAPELSTETPDAYVAAATALAANPDQIAQYRATLRQQVRAAPWADQPRFARAFGDTMRNVARQHGLL